MTNNITPLPEDYATTDPTKHEQINSSILWWVFQAFTEDPEDKEDLFKQNLEGFQKESGLTLSSPDTNFDDIDVLRQFANYLVDNLEGNLSDEVTRTTGIPASDYISVENYDELLKEWESNPIGAPPENLTWTYPIQDLLKTNITDIGNEKYSTQMQILLNGVNLSEKILGKLNSFFELYAQQTDTGATLEGIPDDITNTNDFEPRYISVSELTKGDHIKLQNLYDEIQTLNFELPSKSITSTYGTISFTSLKEQIDTVLDDFEPYYDISQFENLKTRWQQDLDSTGKSNDRVSVGAHITSALSAAGLLSGDLKADLTTNLNDYQEFYKLAGSLLDQIDKALAKINNGI